MIEEMPHPTSGPQANHLRRGNGLHNGIRLHCRHHRRHARPQPRHFGSPAPPRDIPPSNPEQSRKYLPDDLPARIIRPLCSRRHGHERTHGLRTRTRRRHAIQPLLHTRQSNIRAPRRRNSLVLCLGRNPGADLPGLEQRLQRDSLRGRRLLHNDLRHPALHQRPPTATDASQNTQFQVAQHTGLHL